MLHCIRLLMQFIEILVESKIPVQKASENGKKENFEESSFFLLLTSYVFHSLAPKENK